MKFHSWKKPFSFVRFFDFTPHLNAMNISLENPYGDVTIPRAKLRGDSSTIIMNPMALDSSYNRTNATNPYASFKTPGDNNPSHVPVYGEAKNGTQNPSLYSTQAGYTVKEDTEQVGRCYACCCRCRRRKWDVPSGAMHYGFTNCETGSRNFDELSNPVWKLNITALWPDSATVLDEAFVFYMYIWINLLLLSWYSSIQLYCFCWTT